MNSKSMMRFAALISLCLCAPPLLHAQDERGDSAADAANKPIPVTDIDAIKAATDEERTVVGTVTDANKSGSGHNYLNFDSTDFYIFVHSGSIGSFTEGEPADIYLNKEVSIVGTIEEYNGKMQIVLNGPDQVTVVGESTAGFDPAMPADTPAKDSPPATTVTGGSGVVDAADTEGILAAAGNRVVVRGFISRTDKAATTGANFLNFKDSDFAVVIFGRTLTEFTKGEPFKIFKEQWVEVSGTVEFYKDDKKRPQIVIEDPGQIKIVPEPSKAAPAPATAPDSATPPPVSDPGRERVDPMEYFSK